jgi:uncharacterized membrane protein HdeD (DUF308 family)
MTAYPWEVDVAGTVRTGEHGHIPHFTLNSDGQSHKVLNALTVFVLIAGLASFVFGLIIANVTHPGRGLAIPAGVLGLVALIAGLSSQMWSATREERILIVTGIVCGFVGLALGLAHGAFG